MKKHSFKKDLALGALIACSLADPIYADNFSTTPNEEKDTPPHSCKKR